LPLLPAEEEEEEQEGVQAKDNIGAARKNRLAR
jgi:hypothetical protein